jgi:hypothetical protein
MITGKALPQIKDELPPSQTEIDELSRLWDATVPKYYKTLLDAGKPESRFDFDKAKGVYIHRKTGRALDAKEVKRVYLLFTQGMKV